MIDLRSDTITRPTEAMLESMREASYGDDSRDGDETVMKLEALAAESTGKEAGAFMPSGTMTNLVAVLAHTQRGGEVLLEQSAHILVSEIGGIAGLAGMFYRGVPGKRGAMDVEALHEKIRPMTRNNLGTALVCMETTHNQAGGAVLPLAHMQAVHTLAHEHGVPVHTDGARLFNAAVALGVDARQIAQYTDSVGFCVSKGLSAPVGSVLCGSKEFIERARAFRRMVGGGMRQVGVIAAAGLVALEEGPKRLNIDHENAKALAEGLAKIPRIRINPEKVQTNIVIFDLGETGLTSKQFLERLAQRKVLGGPVDARRIRMVTHLDVDRSDIEQSLKIIGEVVGGGF